MLPNINSGRKEKKGQEKNQQRAALKVAYQISYFKTFLYNKVFDFSFQGNAGMILLHALKVIMKLKNNFFSVAYNNDTIRAMDGESKFIANRRCYPAISSLLLRMFLYHLYVQLCSTIYLDLICQRFFVIIPNDDSNTILKNTIGANQKWFVCTSIHNIFLKSMA